MQVPIDDSHACKLRDLECCSGMNTRLIRGARAGKFLRSSNGCPRGRPRHNWITPATPAERAVIMHDGVDFDWILRLMTLDAI